MSSLRCFVVSSRLVAPGMLPVELWGDAIYLNGAQMTVSGEGVLPQFPIPGKTVAAPMESVWTGGDGNTFRFPPFSYGFIVFPKAGVAACGKANGD